MNAVRGDKLRKPESFVHEGPGSSYQEISRLSVVTPVYSRSAAQTGFLKVPGEDALRFSC